tara:strand:+ start:1312 stop:2136 length:825 start_codon:yes stop_codon:yes gene_type:complete
MNVVGLGGAGCKIAKCFEAYDQYNVVYIDHESHGNTTVLVDKQDHPEKYESSEIDFDEVRALCNDVEMVFFVCGASLVSSLSLRILEHIQDKKIHVYYVRPDISMLSSMRQANEKVVFNVLQQFARSGKFDRITLLDNQMIEELLGDMPIIGFWDKINEVISYSVHMLNVFHNNTPVWGGLEQPNISNRISSFGMKDMSTMKENMFFSLDGEKELCYIYAVNRERLEEANDLLKKIREDLKSRLTDNLNISFGIFPTDYDRDVGYVLKHTSIVQ